MENLNAEQVKRLADDFMQMSNALGDYRYNNFSSLSGEENARLKDLHDRTLSHTTELYTKSAVLVMKDVEGALVQIRTITEDTKALYKKLAGVQTVMDRATSVLGLASNIINLDVNGITGSIQGILG